MQKYHYAYEKLHGAVKVMATGKGSRNDRLESATINYVIRLQARNMPPELVEPLDNFMRGMTFLSSPYERIGDITWTAKRMHWRKAEQLAELLFQMFSELNENHFSS